METVTVSISSVLWDRVVDSISTEHGSQYGRGQEPSAWKWRKVGFGYQATIALPESTAVEVLQYIESIGRLDGSGMDPEGAAETRAEAQAARSAAKRLRRQLEA